MADKKISQLTEKAALVGNDVITILDSEASNANKKAKISALPQSSASSDGILTSTDWNKFSNKAAYQILTEDTTHTTVSLDVDNMNFYNKLYRYTQPLTELTLSGAPIETSASTYRYETEIQFTTGATFTFTASGLANRWIGISTPSFEANTSYIIAIKNGYAVLGKVGA